MPTILRKDGFRVVIEIDRAEAAAKLADAIEPRALSARYDAQTQMVVIQLRDGSVFMFPHHLGQGLGGARAADLAAVEVTPSGLGLHWEALDVDLQVPSLLRGIYGTKAWMARLGEGRGAEG
jgi:hypothetical protein